ncbi:MAG: ECF transporter S component [Oscillospiraceae bacterium]|nr:ECF transporter S component [Oscillospiraceae bacterium]
MKNEKLKKMIVLSMLAAISYLTVFLIRIPFIPSVEFLKYEAKDVIIAISGFLYGPLSASLVSVVVSLIEMLTISGTGPYGLIMNIFSTLSFVLPASIIYKRKKTINSAVIGLCAGVVMMTIAMLMWNYFITPLYLKVPTEVVVGLMLPGFLPFNLIKALINAVITFILYKPLVKILRKAKLMPKQEETENSEKKSALLFNIIALLILVLLVGIIIVIKFLK